MYNFCVKYKKKEHKKPTCKTLLKAIDLAREAERLCLQVEEYYNRAMAQDRIYAERKFMYSYGGIIGMHENFSFFKNDLAQALNSNYENLKLLVKNCSKCKKLATCSILNYVKEATLKP
jgi:hypothetical protein